MAMEFFDDHPAKCQRPLEGANIRSREMAIGWDVAIRQLLEAIADLDDHTIDRIAVMVIRTMSTTAMPMIFRSD